MFPTTFLSLLFYSISKRRSLWGSTLGNLLFSTHIHFLKSSCIGMCLATLLMPFPPHIHSSFCSVSWERQGWCLSHLRPSGKVWSMGNTSSRLEGRRTTWGISSSHILPTIPSGSGNGCVLLCLLTGTSNLTEVSVFIP